ncbi:MBL fold metallo-hydrolase [Thiobacter aerophilum]|uniref:MBL fold metallo-hydrolase n=1 Tax=Thiobacter aerophilum TaxID=3121275 RepID=A0ABV0EH99_9BURK
MRKLMLTLALLFVVPMAWAGLPAPKVHKVNDRIYALIGPMEFPNPKNQGYMVNSTVIVGEKGVILIDTGFTDEVGKHLAATIAKLTPKPVTHIINTHHHGDHTLGNVAFPGARIISSEKCRSELEKTGAEWIQIVENATGRKFSNTRPVLAHATYQENTRVDLTIDGVRMVLWTPFGSHTAGDMLVYLPDDKVLVAGDVLVHRIMPAFRDAYVKNWVNTLEEVGKLDFKTAIPGHGPLMTKADALKFHRMMARLYAGVEAGYKKGLTDSEIRNTLDLSEWKRLKHFEESMGGNINRTYLEVEAANF